MRPAEHTYKTVKGKPIRESKVKVNHTRLLDGIILISNKDENWDKTHDLVVLYLTQFLCVVSGVMVSAVQ